MDVVTGRIRVARELALFTLTDSWPLSHAIAGLRLARTNIFTRFAATYASSSASLNGCVASLNTRVPPSASELEPVSRACDASLTATNEPATESATVAGLVPVNVTLPLISAVTGWPLIVVVRNGAALLLRGCDGD